MKAAAADEKKRNEIAGERRMGDPKAKRLKVWRERERE